MTNTREDHRAAVVELLSLDPISAEAVELRVKIARLEQNDPTLIAQRIAIMAASVRPIGEMPPAERAAAGVMLT